MLFAGPEGADAQGSIAQNGSFETVGNRPLRVDPWVPVSWSALLGNWSNAPDGVNYILVDTIYQDLTTSLGQQYMVSFHGAADLYSGPTAQIRALWNGSVAATFSTQPHTYNPQVNRYEQIVWEAFSFSVMAGGLNTRLEFQSANGIDYLFDNVRVVAVPEPSALSLTAVLLLGCTARRRLWVRKLHLTTNYEHTNL